MENTFDEKVIKEFKNILNFNKIEIPNSYFEYLISNSFKPTLNIFDDGYDFKLYTLKELCTETNIRGKKMLQVKGFSNSLKAIIEIMENTEHEKFLNCIAIGFEETLILFIDKKDNNTLYIFDIDSCDINKVEKLTLEDIIKNNK